jgi:UDP-glucose 4-epimerase
VNFFLRQAMNGMSIQVFGDGMQIRDYVYVEDLALAFLLAAVNEEAIGESFNVGSGKGTRFRDMVETVIDVVGKGQIEYVEWPDDYLHVETGDYITDISKIVTMLGWQPQIDLRAGITRTFDYYRQYREHYF